MNNHDWSAWSKNPEIRDWADVAMTILCCAVLCFWLYDYIERMAG